MSDLYAISDRGVLLFNGIDRFTLQHAVVGNPFAIAAGPTGELFAGGTLLQDFRQAGCGNMDVFPANDDLIRSLVLETIAGGFLFIASDGYGLRQLGTGASTCAAYTPQGASDVPADIRDLTLDGEDIWMATAQGIALYKRAAQAVVRIMAFDDGTPFPGQQLDVKSVALDRSVNPARLFFGTKRGVLVLETP
jgi:hypothetical protein